MNKKRKIKVKLKISKSELMELANSNTKSYNAYIAYAKVCQLQPLENRERKIHIEHNKEKDQFFVGLEYSIGGKFLSAI